MNRIPIFDRYKYCAASILLIFVSLSLWSCDRSQYKSIDGAIASKNGIITFLHPPLTEFVDQPYQVDFSELDKMYYSQWENDAVIEPDLTFDGFNLEAGNGIVDYGPFKLLGCLYFSPDIPTSANGAQSLVKRLEFNFRMLDFVVPTDGFSTTVQLELCHLYFIRTDEGKTIAFMNIGRYIGGINRNHFFWTYSEY